MLAGGDFDGAVFADGIDGIEDEVGDDFLELVVVGEDGTEVGKVGLNRDGDLLVRIEESFDAFVEVHGGAIDLEFLAEEAEAGDEFLDVVDAFADGFESVFAEFRIIKMLGEVLEGEVESGGGVFEVVDKESGDGLKGFHFLGLDEAVGELEVEQIGSGLVADAFEEFEFLEFEGDVIHAIAESAEANEASGGCEWNADSIAGFGEMVGKKCLEAGDPTFLS